MVSLRAIDALVRATPLRRAVAFQLALWIAAVLIYAIYSAYRDRINSYEPIYLALLTLGVPSVLGLVFYAFSLLSASVRRNLAVFVGVGVLGVIVVIVAQKLAIERAKQLDIAKQARIVEGRKLAKREQDSRDLATYAETCRVSCGQEYKPDTDCVSRCAIGRGNLDRKEKWRRDNAPCEEQCAADLSPECNSLCEIAKIFPNIPNKREQ